MRQLIVLLLFCFLSGGTVLGQYTAGETYFGVNEYIEYRAGNLPIIIVAPHAGTILPEELPDIHDRGPDNGTLETTQALWDTIKTQTNGCYPHVVFCHLHPKKLNPVDEIDSAAGTNPVTRNAWEEFHAFIEVAKAKVTEEWGKGHYFEMHGNGHAEMWNEVGLGVSKVYLNESDEAIMERLTLSTVKNLCTVGGADFLEVVKGGNSLGGMLQERGWKSVPSPEYPAPGDGGFFYAGWNIWLHGSRYEGTIDATHLENYFVFMQIANRAEYTSDLAESILLFMATHYGFTLNCSDLGYPIENEEPTTLFPNPAYRGSVIHITAAKKMSVIKLFDPIGKAMMVELTGNMFTIPTTVKKGVYTVVIEWESGRIEKRRLIVI